MANPIVVTPASFSSAVWEEADYNSGTSGGTNYGALGVAMKYTEFSASNQFDNLLQIGQRTPLAYFSKGDVFNITTEFVLADDNKNWLNFLLYNNAGTYEVGSIKSGAIQLYDVVGSKLYEATGIAFDNASITFNSGETVNVTLGGKGSKFSGRVDTTPITTTYPVGYVTWVNASVSVGGVTITQPVKSLSIKMENNVEYFYTLGSLNYVSYVPKEFKFTATLEVLHDSGFIDALMQESSPATDTTLSITAGTYTFNVSGVYLNQGSMNIEPVNPVEDKIEIVANSITVT